MTFFSLLPKINKLARKLISKLWKIISKARTLYLTKELPLKLIIIFNKSKRYKQIYIFFLIKLKEYSSIINNIQQIKAEISEKANLFSVQNIRV